MGGLSPSVASASANPAFYTSMGPTSSLGGYSNQSDGTPGLPFGFGFPSSGDPLFYQMPAASSFYINKLLGFANGSAVNINVGPIPSTLGMGGLLLGMPFYGGGDTVPGQGTPLQGALGSLASGGNLSGMDNSGFGGGYDPFAQQSPSSSGLTPDQSAILGNPQGGSLAGLGNGPVSSMPQQYMGNPHANSIGNPYLGSTGLGSPIPQQYMSNPYANSIGNPYLGNNGLSSSSLGSLGLGGLGSSGLGSLGLGGLGSNSLGSLGLGGLGSSSLGSLGLSGLGSSSLGSLGLGGLGATNLMPSPAPAPSSNNFLNQLLPIMLVAFIMKKGNLFNFNSSQPSQTQTTTQNQTTIQTGSA